MGITLVGYLLEGFLCRLVNQQVPVGDETLATHILRVSAVREAGVGEVWLADATQVLG